MLGACILLAAIPATYAEEVFSTDFSKGSFAELGWDESGGWKMTDLAAKVPDLKNNPGLVATFPAGGQVVGTLTKKFSVVENPAELKLVFDAGYGWGAKDQSQALQVMILDEKGNGYGFDSHRANATWGAQWAKITNYEFPAQTNWASAAIDTTQTAVVDGGGLKKFTVTRKADGTWRFEGENWQGGLLTFSDATVNSFSQVVLRGTPNTCDLLFSKVTLQK